MKYASCVIETRPRFVRLLVNESSFPVDSFSPRGRSGTRKISFVSRNDVRLDVHSMCGIFHQGLGKCGNGSNGIFWIVWSIVLEDGSRRRVTYRDRDVVTLRSWSVIW